ncbi:RagB/SusD family nutrient uptake outer membrane protein [uncultured Alistipes sp.]|uniref:RagB/SusD family nutrient uptake outer membrane protein n=1 Tax=uncultured Alistipes sp. TaxID=538949 RepID=UPI0025E4D506|nr:RagB/SusD family nutrient uptake outer membrane protein [uncultured Alistipes sp.]
MKKIYQILLVAAAGAMCACSDFLDPYPSANRSEDYVLQSPTAMQGLIGKCYDYMSQNYNNNEGAYLDCATDNAVRTSPTDVIRRFATGITSPTNDPFVTYWERNYQGIYNVNMFLKDDRGLNMRYMLDPHLDELLRNRLLGEAYALRAWFQWDLLQKFGGRGTDGQMLGYPILLEPIKIWQMSPEQIRNLDIKRNTYDECVAQILADCDMAYQYLPIAHRDFLVSNQDDLRVLGAQNWGRLDGITTVAIKAQVYLTWASPRFNPNGDETRWRKAAEYAKQVMDFKMTVDNVSGGFEVSRKVDWFDPNNPCIIYASRYKSGNDDMERAFYPGSFQGNGTMGATQDLVDAFGMADGYPVGKSPRYAYDPQNPYVNRDPRFYSVIFYNGRSVVTGTTSKTYTFENWSNGGKDAAGATSKNSLTNYHIKKFVYMGVNWSESSVNRMPHAKFFIRWAHMVLAFAEAANQAVGPNTPIDGLTAREAISYLRSRTTYDGAEGIKSDPYLDQVALMGKDAFDKFLRDERRIETCFEGTWFFDLRRWTTTLGELNREVHGAEVTRKDNGDYEYDLGHVIEKRSFSSAYLPIPYREMLNLKGLVQNEGWENWQ